MLKEKVSQEDLRKFVDREVYYCVSGIVSRLAELEPDEWYHMFCQHQDYFWCYCEKCGNEWEDWTEDEPENCPKCGSDDVDISIETDERDIFEHWIVSDWLARQLESHGEVVEMDFHGLTVWGRSTTGQAILLDGVIERIYVEMMER